MRVITLKNLRDFGLRYPDAEIALRVWSHEAGKSSWKSPQDIKDRYASASFLAGNTVIFNIKGNSYRFVTTIAFGTGVVVVEWVGTHREYDAFSRNR